MISVDTVYQRVLALANKEQRGYITPQEFNLYANQAQMDIFRQYFYDINQFKRVPGNSSSYSSTTDLIEEKLSMFKIGPVGIGDVEPLQNHVNFYKITQVSKQDANSVSSVAQKINYEDYHTSQKGPLTRATENRPIYYVKDNSIYVFPLIGTNQFTYIRRPNKVSWTYVVVDEKALYNPSNGSHADFELHISEETNLVIKILQLSGLSIKDYNVVQAAAQKEIGTIQQEKQ